jgi:hypothetical protein
MQGTTAILGHKHAACTGELRRPRGVHAKVNQVLPVWRTWSITERNSPHRHRYCRVFSFCRLAPTPLLLQGPTSSRSNQASFWLVHRDGRPCPSPRFVLIRPHPIQHILHGTYWEKAAFEWHLSRHSSACSRLRIEPTADPLALIRSLVRVCGHRLDPIASLCPHEARGETETGRG